MDLKKQLFSLNINEIHKRVIDYGPYEWIDPKDITGLNKEKIKKENKKKWFTPVDSNAEDEEESEDEIIVDYLTDCLSEQENKSSIHQNRIKIDGIMFLEAAIFLICELGSSYAKTHLILYKNVIDSDKLQRCMDLLIESHTNTQELYVKDILRDFILELFEYGPLWDLKKSNHNYLDKKSILFLDEILRNGYFTIDNENAMCFSDGSKRFSD